MSTQPQLPAVPPEGQPPNPLLDPRVWGFVVAGIGLLVKRIGWEWSEAIAADLLALLPAVALYVWGQWRSRNRREVVKDTINQVGAMNPQEFRAAVKVQENR